MSKHVISELSSGHGNVLNCFKRM